MDWFIDTHTFSKEKILELLEHLEDLGYVWISGRKPTDNTYELPWTYIAFESYWGKGLVYSDWPIAPEGWLDVIKHNEFQGRTEVTFEEIMAWEAKK